MEIKPIYYPVSTANFKRIREEGMLYVDKTHYIGQLLDTRNQYFFLARPRRFGKSLFLNTLEEYFSANRELFRGLAIDRLQPGEWQKYSVIRFDLSGNPYLEKDDLSRLLHLTISRYEEEFGVQSSIENIGDRFEHLIREVSKTTGQQVVILVDEYDSPLTSTINRAELHEIFRNQLHGFYSVLKKLEKDIRFCFLTGVTRYGKVSVFSGLNNLEDITFLDEFAGICGVTEEELHQYYDKGVTQFAEAKNLTSQQVYEQLKFHYDGYHFTECMLDVYNPFSLNRALRYKRIKNYWCESGTPLVFILMLMQMDYDVEKLQGVKVKEKVLSNLGAFTTNPIPLFFQTGYLTIKSYDEETQMFELGYPNREVESGILSNILEVYNPYGEDGEVLYEMRRSLNSGDPEQFVTSMHTYFASIPPNLKTKVANYERYYQTVIYCLLSLLGLETKAEYGVAGGYIDLLIQTENYIYIIEMKVNGTAAEAMQQIDRKKYCAPFALDSRRLYRIALGFSKETQNLSGHIIIPNPS